MNKLDGEGHRQESETQADCGVGSGTREDTRDAVFDLPASTDTIAGADPTKQSAASMEGGPKDFSVNVIASMDGLT